MKVLDLIKRLQEMYTYFGNVEVITTELDDVTLICEPHDTKEIKAVDGLLFGEGCIVLKI